MPFYPRRCLPCDHSFEVFRTPPRGSATVSDLVRCPKCNGPSEPNFQELNIRDTNTVFVGSGQMSITEGFHPKEVPKARKLMKDLGGCIMDDGRVRFDNRAQVNQWHRRKAQVAERALHQNTPK